MLEAVPVVCRRFLSACLLLLAAGAPAARSADEQPLLHDARYCAPDGIALGGYDVVSYFEKTGPVLGTPEWTTRRGGFDRCGRGGRFAGDFAHQVAKSVGQIACGSKAIVWRLGVRSSEELETLLTSPLAGSTGQRRRGFEDPHDPERDLDRDLRL